MRDKAIFPSPHFEAKRLTRYSIRCINGIIEARVLTDRDLPADTPPEPMFDDVPAKDENESLRCAFLTGDDSSRWYAMIAKKEAGKQGNHRQTIYMNGIYEWARAILCKIFFFI